MPCKNSEIWIGCYKNNTDLWCPDAYCHPAKMSPGLAFRILDHLVELGLLQQNDVILDPMCGIATTLLCSAVRGFKAVGVELETRFKDLAEANKAHLEKKLGHSIDLTILQGDSRNLSTLLSERGLIMVSSPPYHQTGNKIPSGSITEYKNVTGEWRTGMKYSDNPNNIGNLPEGKVIITSPPYESQGFKCDENPANVVRRENKRHELYPMRPKVVPGHYSDSYDNIGNTMNESYWSAMKQVYQESLKIADVMVLVTKDPTRNKSIHPLGQMTADLITSIGWRIVDWHKAILYDTQEQGGLFGESKKIYKGRVSFFKRLSLQKGSPAAAHEDVIFAVNPNGRRSGIVEVTSPPYSDSEGHPSLGSVNNDNWGTEGKDITARRNKTGSYGATPGQIGNMPEGRVIISSPPYGNIETGPNGGSKEFENDRISKSHSERHGRHYSSNSANIGNLRE